MPLTPSQFQIENLPPECVEFIRRKEGKRLKAYRDPGGYALPTIGYGHTKGVTVADVENGRTITDAKAEEFLYEDVEDALEVIRNSVKVELTPYQLGAITSFVFNVGHGRASTKTTPGKDGFVVLKNGKPSTMLSRLNAGDYDAAAEQFSKWVYAGGKRMPGLISRRSEEAVFFCKSPTVPPVAVSPPPELAPPKPPDPAPGHEEGATLPKPVLVDQKSPLPTRKVIAGGGVGVAVFCFTVWWNRNYPESTIAAEEATALASGLIFAVQYIVRNRDNPTVPASPPPNVSDQ